MVLSISTNKKAQIWSIDLIIAVVIFFAAFFVFYKYGLGALDSARDDKSFLLQDTKLISNYLVSAGYPQSWTTETVTLIGLTDGESRLDPNKVEMFSNMSKSSYLQTKNILSASHDFYIFFEDSNSNKIKIRNISSIGKNYTNDNPDNLLKIERFIFYNSSIIKMVIYTW